MATPAVKQLSYEDLEAELKRREKTVRQLQRKRERLVAQLAEVEQEIAAIGGTKARQHAGGRRPSNEKNLVDAMADTLKGKVLSVTELAEAVQQDGYKTTSPNFRTIVNQALLRDDRFKRVSRGKYTVKGARSTTKKKRTSRRKAAKG